MPHLPPLIQQMLRPAFYPHAVERPVRLIQTHISFVVLTGPYAYKMKKAVNLGFLDFSTLERRRHFCFEELRLNARGAPDLYLDVLAVTSSDGRFQFGGAGDRAEEYVLQMRQLPQESLASAMLARGEFGDAEALALAAAVAQYHGAAPTDGHVASYGAAERVGASIEQNYRQTERFAGRLIPRRRFDEIGAYTARFLRERRDLLAARAADGHVRECHGDLHLNNVCFWERRVLLFDCIEFDEAYRCVDTMYDAAFAAMDFDARGRPDLGNTFLNAYAERTSDWAGLRILPLYLCRQAYVRAKVNSLLAEELAGDNSAAAPRGQAERGATRYYDLAWRYTLPRRGQVFVMSGLSGSGKSTVARALARRTGAIQIRSDAVRKHLAGVPLDCRGGPDLYSQHMTRRTYDRLAELGLGLASDGYTVVLDAKFDRAAERAKVCEACAARGLPFAILHCEAPEYVLRQRLGMRRSDVSDATGDLLESQSAGAEPFDEAERAAVIGLDTTRPAEELAAVVASRLNPGAQAG